MNLDFTAVYRGKVVFVYPCNICAPEGVYSTAGDKVTASSQTMLTCIFFWNNTMKLWFSLQHVKDIFNPSFKLVKFVYVESCSYAVCWFKSLKWTEKIISSSRWFLNSCGSLSPDRLLILVTHIFCFHWLRDFHWQTRVKLILFEYFFFFTVRKNL